MKYKRSPTPGNSVASTISHLGKLSKKCVNKEIIFIGGRGSRRMQKFHYFLFPYQGERVGEGVKVNEDNFLICALFLKASLINLLLHWHMSPIRPLMSIYFHQPFLCPFDLNPPYIKQANFFLLPAPVARNPCCYYTNKDL